MKMNGEASSGPEAVTTGEWSALAETRSRIYGFLAAVYNRLPDEQFAASLTGSDLAGFVAALARDEDLPQGMRLGLGLIEEYIEESRGKEVEEVLTELAVDRTRLLRGVKPGYGPPPPYESVYLGPEDAPVPRASVAVRQIYAEAGVGLPEEVKDQPDFIGFELDFMRHLTANEAHAWAKGDGQRAIAALQQEEAFLQAHISQWIPRFCGVMAKEARLGFYQGIAEMTKGFVQDEAEKVAKYLECGTATATASHGGQEDE